MENTEPCIKSINNFDYLLLNGIKYFIGDFIKVNNIKFRIENFTSLMHNNIAVEVSNKSIRTFINANTIEGFYYKKDIKKYSIQRKPRIYEFPLDTIVTDCFGKQDKLSKMVFAEGKLCNIDDCVKYMGNPYSDIVKYIHKTQITRIGSQIACCTITNIYYDKTSIKKAYKITFDNLASKFIPVQVLVNSKSYLELPSTYLKYFNPTSREHDKIIITNADYLLTKHNDIFVIGPKSGMIVRKDRLKQDDGYKKYDNGYYFPEFSNLKSKSNDTSFNYKFGLDSNTHLITEGLKYTFGVEIEMADCCFPPHFFTDMNIKVEKDGSIKNTRGEKYGPEVITGVLKGDKGFEHLQYICTELAKRSEINHTCGIHTHIGNANFNNANIVMLFKLAKILEKDIFRMLPVSRSKNEYCRALPDLDFNFNNCNSIMDLKIRIDNYYTELFTLAANCPPNDKVNKTKNHPRGAKVGYDHNNIRYCWINFIPALFNTRNTNPPSYTIEFRPFNASTNFTKIKNWIKICMAIVNFSENYHRDIMKGVVTIDGKEQPITLKNVVRKIYPKSYRKLTEFIDTRTEIFSSSHNEDVDVNSDNVKLNIKQLIS